MLILLGQVLLALLALALFGPILLEQLARHRTSNAEYIDPRRRVR